MHSMERWIRWVSGAGVFAALLTVPHVEDGPARIRPSRPSVTPPGRSRIGFEPNRGQADPEAAFVAREAGFSAELRAGGAALAWRAAGDSEPAMVKLRFVGGRPPRAMIARDELPAHSHYYVGNDPAQWRVGIPQYALVEYADVYPGVSVVFHAQPGALRYDFVVAPGADVNAIVLDFEGARDVRVDEAGDLVLATAAGEVRQHPPAIYQERGGRREPVDGGYVLRGPRRVGVLLAGYDRREALVIDPTLVYSTYRGDVRRDYGNAVAIDATGAAFVAGGFNMGDNTDTDVFVAKFDPTGQTLLWRTQIRGQLSEEAAGIALDSAGNVHITGVTTSGPSSPPGRPEYPRTPDALQPAYGGGSSDAFVSVLGPDGTLLYSTFLGGSGDDQGAAIALDVTGDAYLTGRTSSTDFPLAHPLQATLAGGYDAWMARMNACKSALVYSSYLGGSGDDRGSSLALDASRHAYVAGTTSSPDFPTVSPLQPTLGGASDAFVSKVARRGRRLLYSTYIGGSNAEEGRGMALDATAHVYLTGTTDSPDFPTAHPLEAAPSAPPAADAFLAKLRRRGNGFVYSTFLGAKGGSGVAVDGDGNAYLTGGSVLAARLDSTGSTLGYALWSMGGNAIVVDGHGDAYVTGGTFSNLLPTQGAQQPRNGGMFSARGRDDAFLVKIAAADAPPPAIEEGDARVSYTGTWVADDAPEHSGGRAVFSDEPGASASISFTGTGIQVIGRREESSGLAQITTESTALWGSLDTYASPPEEQALLVSITGLPAGPHTLEVTVAGARGPRAQGNRVWIDGFNVLGAPDAP